MTQTQTDSHPANTQSRVKKYRSVPRRIRDIVLLSIFVSIALEWIGMVFLWPEQRSFHAYRMLEAEIEFLNDQLVAGIKGWSAGQSVSRIAMTGYHYVFQFTRIEDGLVWLGQITGLRDYVSAMLYISQLFFVRLGIMIMSLPLFALFMVVGVTSGLTLRDIRRWSAGREFGAVYHHAKKWAPGVLVCAWFIYLTIPISIHPNAILLPCAVCLGINVLVLSSSFKKYL